MSSWLFEFGSAVWLHKPSTGFITASLGLNLALAVYRPLLKLILASLKEPYVARELVRIAESQLNDTDKMRINFQLGRLRSGLESLGERSIREAQTAAVCLVVLSFVLLFIDWSNGLVVFLPTIPLWFTLRVRHHAKKRYAKYTNSVISYIHMCADSSRGDIQRSIRESLQIDSIHIITATYGRDDKKVDVTDALKKLVQGGSLVVKASNELAGDPSPSIVKELTVQFSISGKTVTKTVQEGEMLRIP